MATTASLNDDGSRSLSGDELEVIFRPAMDRFLQSIPEEDRCEVRSFKSIEEVDAHIKALVAENPRLASIPEGVDRFCQSIGRLSGKLEPYFSAIDSFSSAKPEILGLIWGSVQLLFKVSHLVSQSRSAQQLHDDIQLTADITAVQELPNLP